MNTILTLALAPLAWQCCCLYSLFNNYRWASKVGIPLVVTLISPDNQIWIALQTAFPSIFRRIDFRLLPLLRYSRLGWEFHDRYKTHEKLGDTYMLVTPAKNWLYVGEAVASYEIFSRSRDFGRPTWMLAMLDVFGPSVSTVGYSDWQRHRKLTATPFNEQKSTLVWAESLRQADDMLHSWLAQDSKGFTCTSDDVRTLALDVLAFAGFQKSYSWRPTTEGPESDQPITYRDSLSLILQNVLTIVVLTPKFFQLPYLPRKLHRIGLAIKEFKSYMLSQIAEEKNLEAQGHSGSGTLVSNLVRASSEAKSSHVKPLTTEEILGNIFVFNFAGHDTTAISTNYAMMLLTARPDIQEWISEELSFYLNKSEAGDWQYEIVFPKLNRCLAVLLETLRLYSPLPGVPKYAESPQTLTVNGKNIFIPADTLVVPVQQTLHTHPRYWGKDSLEWNPKRWIVSASTSQSEPSSTDLGAMLADEKIMETQKGVFNAWAEGVRSCPGRKFAQVEFVAVMAKLFRDNTVEPVAKDGENSVEARERVMGVVKNSNVNLLLEMEDPRSVAVRWRKR